MKRILFISALTIFLVPVIIFSSCSKSNNIIDPEQTPGVVVSDAGPDRGIILPRDTVTLYGSGMAYHSTIASYRWTKILGPIQGSIVNPYNPETLVRDLVAGVYKFELTVTNSEGKTASDKVCITVYDHAPDPCLGCWDY